MLQGMSLSSIYLNDPQNVGLHQDRLQYELKLLCFSNHYDI